MTTLQMLRRIQEEYVLYSINFRRSGIGMTFFEDARVENREVNKFGSLVHWRQGLVTYSYHPTFALCVRVTYQRLFGKNRSDK